MSNPYESATTVAVAASSVPGEFLVPDLVAALADQQPGYAVSTTATDSAGVFAALRSGEAEVGFAGVEPDGDDLVATAVDADEIVLAVGPGHPLAGRDTVTVGELASTTLVEREEGSGTRRSFVDALADRGTPLFVDDWTVRDSNAGLLDAVAEGVGVGVVSSWVLERDARDDVRTVRLEGDPVRRCLYLVVRRDDDTLGPAATTFVELVRARTDR